MAISDDMLPRHCRLGGEWDYEIQVLLDVLWRAEDAMVDNLPNGKSLLK
jgi:hypothetical protein